MIRPLTLECKVKDELVKRLRIAHETNLKELKVVSTVLRIPRMCQDFHNAMRKRFEREQLEKIQKNAFDQMLVWNVKNSVSQKRCISDLVENLT